MIHASASAVLISAYMFGAQAYFGKSSAKINHLRADSLAMLLSLANIGSHGKVPQTNLLTAPSSTEPTKAFHHKAIMCALPAIADSRVPLKPYAAHVGILHCHYRSVNHLCFTHFTLSLFMQVLVLETCSGLVTGAVAERLGGFGHICTTYVGGKCPPLEATRMLNFPDSIRNSMSTASLATLLQYQGEPAADGAAQGPGEEDKVRGGLLDEAGQQVLQTAWVLLKMMCIHLHDQSC